MTKYQKNNDLENFGNSFESVARRVGCDETDEALDKAFENLDIKVEEKEDSTEEEK